MNAQIQEFDDTAPADEPVAATIASKYPIEKGVALPPRRHGRTLKGESRDVYRFAELEVGDSFFVPNGRAGRLAALVSYHSKGPARLFSLREFDSDPVHGRPGVRIWRTR